MPTQKHRAHIKGRAGIRLGSWWKVLIHTAGSFSVCLPPSLPCKEESCASHGDLHLNFTAHGKLRQKNHLGYILRLSLATLKDLGRREKEREKQGKELALGHCLELETCKRCCKQHLGSFRMAGMQQRTLQPRGPLKDQKILQPATWTDDPKKTLSSPFPWPLHSPRTMGNLPMCTSTGKPSGSF